VKISCSTRLRESTIKNLRELLKNQINQQINLIFFVEDQTSFYTSFFFNHQVSSFIQLSFQTNFIMFNRSFTEEHFKAFRNRFSQIFDADSSKLFNAESFISEDDESFTETVILSVSIEN